MPEISVIVPVYKVEDYIHRCIESVLMQTYKDFELILVDDGSPDNSGPICDEYALQDRRIYAVHQENKGVSAARNTGLAIAKGRYITFLDSDDYWREDYLEKMYANVCELTISGIMTCDQTGRELHSTNYSPVVYTERDKIDFTKLYQEFVLYSPYCKLFQKDIIDKNGLCFPVGITWGEDGMFVADYLSHINSLKVLDYVGYYYIKYDNQNSLSTKVRENIMDMISYSREYCIEKIGEIQPLQKDKVRDICTRDICSNCTYFLRSLLYSKIEKQKKENILKHFLENKYVAIIIKNPEIYLTEDWAICKTFDKSKNISVILRRFEIYKIVYRLFEFVLQMYLGLPGPLKRCIKFIKKRVYL